MCKYCKNTKTEVNLKYIFAKNISLGVIGKVSFESYINNEGKLSVEIDATAPDDTCITYQPIVYEQIDIEYCPFCGEKL